MADISKGNRTGMTVGDGSAHPRGCICHRRMLKAASKAASWKRGSKSPRVGIVLAAASALIMAQGPLMSADYALAAAKLGPTVMRSSSEAGPQSESKKSLDQMKSEYRRPIEIPFPPDNPYTPAKADLGKILYFDPRVSNSGSQSCASCHNPALNWGDGLAKGIGSGMNQLGRRSPTILNAAWGSIFMWDGKYHV